jgi:sterol 3beta-glucosyltransferase
MQITLLAYGSRGDVEPFVALGKGLLQAGHRVRLAAPEPFARLVQAHGLEFVALPGDPGHLVQELIDHAGRNWLRMLLAMSKFVLPLAARVAERVRSACTGADIIVHSFLLTTAGHEAAKGMGIPDFSAQFFPVFASTAAFPGLPFADLRLGGWYRRLTHEIVNRTFWHGGRFLYRQVCRKNPHLPPLTEWPFDARLARRTPILYAFSPSVVPPSPDWSQGVHVTGYWFLDDQVKWAPPRELLRFLQGGPTPVAVGLGSTVTRNPDSFRKKVLAALAESRQRAVIVGAGLRPQALPETVFAIDQVPYNWLFPRTAAVIHHGGAGTTGAALRAGVPNIVIPFTSDQPFWGRRVHRLGAGPKPIPAQRLTARQLAEAIGVALGDEGMRMRARRLGERIATESGVARAVGIILGEPEIGAECVSC